MSEPTQMTAAERRPLEQSYDTRSVGGNPFSRRTTIGLVSFGVASFVTAIVLAIVGGDVGGSGSAGSDSYSRSAVGHRALVRVLRKLGVPTVISQYESERKANESSVLVIAEPPGSVFKEDTLRAMLEQAPYVLVVLPKWSGKPDPQKSTWLARARLQNTYTVERVLTSVGVTAQIGRYNSIPAESWSTSSFSEGEGPTPTIEIPQLMHEMSANMTSLINAGSGTLLAEVTRANGRLLILSDPDLLNNYGLGRGDNAVLAINIINRLRGRGGAVIFDETLHGFEKKPSLWRSLFEFPLLLPTAQVLLAVLMLLWAATRRFGAPLPVRIGIEPGKEYLVDNTASLLRFGGHAAYMLDRYLHATLHQVSDRLHAPPTLNDRDLQAWLERVANGRGATIRLSALVAHINGLIATGKRSDSRAIVMAANRLYRWKQEVLHGSTKRS